MERSEILRAGTLGIKWMEPVFRLKAGYSCAVVIPVYKKFSSLTKFEKASITNTIEVLGGSHELILLCGLSFDCIEYKFGFDYEFSYVKCSDEYFKSQKSYSDLCEEWRLYDFFREKGHEYILICQPDAWVFEDRIDYFAGLGFDYIGAVHMLRADGTNGRVGNGGFSLRKVGKFADVCKETDFSKFGFYLYEDCAFSMKLNNKLNIADVGTGLDFGWQEQPQAAFKKVGKLPFGCHNPMKNNWYFWRNYIKISDEGFNAEEAKALSSVEKFSVGKTYNRSVTLKKRKTIRMPSY